MSSNTVATTAAAAVSPAAAAVAQDVTTKKTRTRAAKVETPATAKPTGTTAPAAPAPAPAKAEGRAIPSLRCHGPQADLKRALAIVAPAAATKATMPVIENVLIASDGGRLKLVATNLEIAVTLWLDGWTFEREGATTMPSVFVDVINTLPSDRITLSLDRRSETMNIVCKGFDTNIKGIGADQFPQIPTVSTAKPTFAILVADLVAAIETVALGAAADFTRPILTGVCIRLDGTRASFAAADGFRLPERVVTLDLPAAKQELVVPATALTQVAKALKGMEADAEVEVIVTDGQVLFHTANIDIVVRRLDGAFPAYERIIPTRYDNRIVVDTAELRKAVKLAGYFATASANILRLTITTTSGGKGKVVLTANAAEVGDNKGEVEGTLEAGTGGQVALNVKFLAEALDCIDTPQVAVETQTDRNPAVLRPVGEKAPHYVHVVLPMTPRN